MVEPHGLTPATPPPGEAPFLPHMIGKVVTVSVTSVTAIHPRTNTFTGRLGWFNRFDKGEIKFQMRDAPGYVTLQPEQRVIITVHSTPRT